MLNLERMTRTPVAQFYRDGPRTIAVVTAWRYRCHAIEGWRGTEVGCGHEVVKKLRKPLRGIATLAPGDTDRPWYGRSLALNRACGEDFQPPRNFIWRCRTCQVQRRYTYAQVKPCMKQRHEVDLVGPG